MLIVAVDQLERSLCLHLCDPGQRWPQLPAERDSIVSGEGRNRVPCFAQPVKKKKKVKKIKMLMLNLC